MNFQQYLEGLEGESTAVFGGTKGCCLCSHTNQCFYFKIFLHELGQIF